MLDKKEKNYEVIMVAKKQPIPDKKRKIKGQTV